MCVSFRRNKKTERLGQPVTKSVASSLRRFVFRLRQPQKSLGVFVGNGFVLPVGQSAVSMEVFQQVNDQLPGPLRKADIRTKENSVAEFPHKLPGRRSRALPFRL